MPVAQVRQRLWTSRCRPGRCAHKSAGTWRRDQRACFLTLRFSTGFDVLKRLRFLRARRRRVMIGH
jgi:hypothetical protein